MVLSGTKIRLKERYTYEFLRIKQEARIMGMKGLKDLKSLDFCPRHGLLLGPSGVKDDFGKGETVLEIE